MSRIPIRLNARQKYSAQPTVVDNVRFASKKEAQRYQDLKLLLRAGKISGLVLQVAFPLRVNGELICTYVCDFRYYDEESGQQVTEDAKGVKTPVYKLKKKLMKAVLGIEVKEI